jgi:hypothetical protein
VCVGGYGVVERRLGNLHETSHRGPQVRLQCLQLPGSAGEIRESELALPLARVYVV